GGVPQGEVHATIRSPHLRLLDLLGTRFIVDGRGEDFLQGEDDGRFPTVYRDGNVRVLENRSALPRAYLVYDVQVVDDPGRVLDRLVDPTFDPRTSVVLEEAPPESPTPAKAGRRAAERSSPDSAEIASYAAER